MKIKKRAFVVILFQLAAASATAAEGLNRTGPRLDLQIVTEKTASAAAQDDERGSTSKNLWIKDPSIYLSVANPKKIQLTKAETEWLKKYRIIRLGVDLNWLPLEFVDENGEYSGMASDYVRMLGEFLNTEMKPHLHGTWSEVLESVKSRKVDILPLRD